MKWSALRSISSFGFYAFELHTKALQQFVNFLG
jgi:hypothetical protein